VIIFSVCTGEMNSRKRLHTGLSYITQFQIFWLPTLRNVVFLTGQFR